MSRSTGLRECRTGSVGVTNGSGNPSGRAIGTRSGSAPAPPRAPRAGARTRPTPPRDRSRAGRRGRRPRPGSRGRARTSRRRAARSRAEVLLGLLDRESEAEVLADEDAEQRGHDRDRLQVGRAPAAGRSLDREADHEADPPRDDPDFVVGVLGDSPQATPPATAASRPASIARPVEPLAVRPRGRRLCRCGAAAAAAALLTGAVRLPAEALEVAHVALIRPALRSRLRSRRHSATRPWSPESRTSGTVQPRNSAGRV